MQASPNKQESEPLHCPSPFEAPPSWPGPNRTKQKKTNINCIFNRQYIRQKIVDIDPKFDWLEWCLQLCLLFFIVQLHRLGKVWCPKTPVGKSELDISRKNSIKWSICIALYIKLTTAWEAHNVSRLAPTKSKAHLIFELASAIAFRLSTQNTTITFIRLCRPSYNPSSTDPPFLSSHVPAVLLESRA